MDTELGIVTPIPKGIGLGFKKLLVLIINVILTTIKQFISTNDLVFQLFPHSRNPVGLIIAVYLQCDVLFF